MPRRDRHKNAATAQSEQIALAGWSWHDLALAELVAALGRVVAAEIRGLADFRQRIVQRLAALALQQRDEMRRALLQKVGGRFQYAPTPFSRRPAPTPESLSRRSD